MDERSYSSNLRFIGAIVLTFALFLGAGYYVYTALFVCPEGTTCSAEYTSQPSPAPVKSK